MFRAFPRGLLGLLGLLGFDLGSQSCIPSLPLLPSEFHLGSLGFDLGSQSWIPLLPLLPSELHLGFNLCILRFRLSSTWDSILDPLVSILEFLPADRGKVFLSTPDTQIVQT